MTPHPMDTMPADIAEEDLALLYCPEQGGWHTAVFFERRWVDFATMTLELKPTHWLPIQAGFPADPCPIHNHDGRCAQMLDDSVEIHIGYSRQKLQGVETDVLRCLRYVVPHAVNALQVFVVLPPSERLCYPSQHSSSGRAHDAREPFGQDRQGTQSESYTK